MKRKRCQEEEPVFGIIDDIPFEIRESIFFMVTIGPYAPYSNCRTKKGLIPHRCIKYVSKEWYKLYHNMIDIDINSLFKKNKYFISTMETLFCSFIKCFKGSISDESLNYFINLKALFMNKSGTLFNRTNLMCLKNNLIYLDVSHNIEVTSEDISQLKNLETLRIEYTEIGLHHLRGVRFPELKLLAMSDPFGRIHNKNATLIHQNARNNNMWNTLPDFLKHVPFECEIFID